MPKDNPQAYLDDDDDDLDADGKKRKKKEAVEGEDAVKGVKKEEIVLAHEVEVRKFDLERGLVYGIVYEPNVKDTHGDFTTAEEIEKAAHEFLPRAATDVNHDANNNPEVAVVESYIAPTDLIFPNGETVRKGAWVLVTKVFDESLKESILKGEVTGYSLEGKAFRL